MSPLPSSYESPRRHPARRARAVAGATSAAAALGIAGYMAVAQGVSSPSEAATVEATAPVTTVPSTAIRAPTTTTTVAAAASAARPFTPARRRITTSRGS